jgi:calcineurin-like phosphoesterase family protein
MKTWFIGDTHFDHRNIISYCNRPFATVADMNKAMIDNWNKVVRKDDKVIMNGDFALCGKERIIEIGQQLNGRKTLILGNHEGASLKTYYDAGFEMVSKYPILVDEFFIVSHMPQHMQENSSYVNVFAHVHDNPAFKDVSARGFCTSAERIGYTPIEFKDIKARIRAASGE